MAVVIPLTAPVEHGSERITQLTLRQPVGKDLRTCGVPYKLTPDQEIVIEGHAMHRMIAALAEVPPSVIDRIAAEDWQEASLAVLGFIMGSASAKTTPA